MLKGEVARKGKVGMTAEASFLLREARLVYRKRSHMIREQVANRAVSFRPCALPSTLDMNPATLAEEQGERNADSRVGRHADHGD